MENHNALTTTNGRLDVETGLLVKNSFLAKSGFVYHAGLREFGNLKIEEGVARGTGTILLTSLLVKEGDGNLLFDADLNKLTNYSREKSRQLVRNGLITMLREAAENEGKYIDEIEVMDIIDQKLKTAYYWQSYKHIFDWARSIGINI